MIAAVWPLDHRDWVEFAPMVGRIERIAPDTPVRLIGSTDGRRTALARLPSRALVARSVGSVGGEIATPGVDVTARAADLSRWFDRAADTAGARTSAPHTSAPDTFADTVGGSDAEVTAGAAEDRDTGTPAAGNDHPPNRDDASWRGGRPPRTGWRRLDRVPAAVVRDLVRAGARAHVDAGDQGLGARAVDTLLDRPVLTVSEGKSTAEVTNRSLSALVAMGFLPHGGHIVVSVNRGWTRVAAEFGSVYAEPRRDGLVLL